MQYFTVLVVASLINLIVDALFVALVFVKIRLFVAPLAFTLPSNVTLSAPLRSMMGLSKEPVTESPVVLG